MRTASIAGPVILTCLCTFVSQADILWDQSNLVDYWNNPSFVTDQEFPPPDPFVNYSSYAVTDVTTGPGSWVIEEVTVYFTRYSAPSPWETVVHQARLNILPKTGPLPDNAYDPRSGQLVPVTLTPLVQNNRNYLAITASGLSIPLAAGQYWVGLTPLAPFASIGYYQEVHAWTANVFGDETAWRNPAGGFGAGTNWMPWSVPGSDAIINTDAAITIQGIPEPATLSLLTVGILALVRPRR